VTLAQLIGQVKRHGYAVVCDDGKPTVRPVKGGAKLPDEVLAMLRQRRDEIIAWMNPPPEPSFLDRHGLMRPDTVEDLNAVLAALNEFDEWNQRITERRHGAANDATDGPARRPQKNVRRRPDETGRQRRGDGRDAGDGDVSGLFA
jgi:hypothetical protein